MWFLKYSWCCIGMSLWESRKASQCMLQGKQNSKGSPEISAPGIHTLYSPFTSNVGGTCEYDG